MTMRCVQSELTRMEPTGTGPPRWTLFTTRTRRTLCTRWTLLTIYPSWTSQPLRASWSSGSYWPWASC